jgi:hypothetical protein
MVLHEITDFEVFHHAGLSILSQCLDLSEELPLRLTPGIELAGSCSQNTHSYVHMLMQVYLPEDEQRRSSFVVCSDGDKSREIKRTKSRE